MQNDRARFFADVRVWAVTNFANLAYVLFGGRSQAPALALFFMPRADTTSGPEEERILALAPFLVNQPVGRTKSVRRNRETWSVVVNGAEMRELPPRVETGLSPHAPYSTSRELIAKLVALADGHARPCAIHLAETMEELAFLRHGIGPIGFLHRRRLDAARRDLIDAVPGTVTVTEVANRYCLAHTGRFAIAYRRAFGESPSDSLKG